MNTLNKVLIGAGVVWLLVLTGLYVAPHAASPAKLGAQIQQEPFWFTNGSQYGSFGTLTNWAHITMGTGANQASWQNTTGQTVYVSSDSVRAQMVTGASSTVTTASTTLFLAVGTTTTATVTNGFKVSGINNSIIDALSIATGSPYVVHDGIVNSAFSGTNEQGMVAVPNGAYVLWVLYDPTGGCIGTNGCESATSTNRGYNLSISFPYSTL